MTIGAKVDNDDDEDADDQEQDEDDDSERNEIKRIAVEGDILISIDCEMYRLLVEAWLRQRWKGRRTCGSGWSHGSNDVLAVVSEKAIFTNESVSDEQRDSLRHHYGFRPFTVVFETERLSRLNDLGGLHGFADQSDTNVVEGVSDDGVDDLGLGDKWVKSVGGSYLMAQLNETFRVGSELDVEHSGRRTVFDEQEEEHSGENQVHDWMAGALEIRALCTLRSIFTWW